MSENYQSTPFTFYKNTFLKNVFLDLEEILKNAKVHIYSECSFPLTSYISIMHLL